MKSIVLLCLLLPFFSFGQNDKGFPSPFEFQYIDSTHGSKSELFVKASEWVAKTFVSAKDVIQMSDKDAGKIIAKGVMESRVKFGLGHSVFYTKYTLSIDVKDNKYRIKLNNFIVEHFNDVSSINAIDPNNATSRDINGNLDDTDPPSLGGLSMSFPMSTWKNIKFNCSSQSNFLAKDFISAMKNKSSDNW